MHGIGMFAVNRPIAVTPSDTDLIAFDNIYVGGDNGAGGSDISITTLDGRDITIGDAQVGQTLKFSGKRIRATGTQATSLLVW